MTYFITVQNKQRSIIKSLKALKILVMFLLIPVHAIHIAAWIAAHRTYEGLSCMDLPNVSVTSIFRTFYNVTLRTGPLPFSFNHYHNRVLSLNLMFLQFLFDYDRWRNWFVNCYRDPCLNHIHQHWWWCWGSHTLKASEANLLCLLHLLLPQTCPILLWYFCGPLLKFYPWQQPF